MYHHGRIAAGAVVLLLAIVLAFFTYQSPLFLSIMAAVGVLAILAGAGLAGFVLTGGRRAGDGSRTFTDAGVGRG